MKFTPKKLLPYTLQCVTPTLRSLSSFSQDVVELMRETMCDTVLGGGAGGGRDPRSRSRGGLQVPP